MQRAEGRTATEILDAFGPYRETIGGRPLVPLRIGHKLLLEKFGHPLASRRPLATEWAAEDLAIALFVFTRPSRELYQMVEDGTFAAEVFAMLDEIPAAELDSLPASLLRHWFASEETMLAMKSPHVSGQKKTAGSGGC
jgi:hypothetical protein